MIGAKLSVCDHCGTLRVVESHRVTFLRRREKEDERVTMIEPQCLTLERRAAIDPWPKDDGASIERPCVAVVAPPQSPPVERRGTLDLWPSSGSEL